MEKTLFSKLYSAADEAIKAMKKPLVERSMKRKFQSAYDSADAKIDEAEFAISAERAKFNEADVNIILEQKLVVRQLTEQRADLEEEYTEMFAEELK